VSALENKKYTGSCYIATVGSEQEYGPARDSIEKIITRNKDFRAEPIRATKGYEARQAHLDNWYNKTKHPFILFLDSDMIFPVNTLERLRAHKAPFVSGFYMRRTIRPVAPVWFERGANGVMPLKPLMAVLEVNKTYPIGASGWGCMLIHRDVIAAMKPILKGELEIIEDDMDVYPYDLKKVLTGKEQLIPLRGIKDEIVGSDIRFPFYAQLAGFPLMGDTGVACLHVTNYPVALDDWLNQPAFSMRDMSLMVNEEDRKEREKIRKAIA
jgi:hypothetical protein